MNIRLANQADAKELAALIFSSAPLVLTAMFSINEKLSAENFLESCLLGAEGQYGYNNHWVAVVDNRVVGCVSAWHSALPSSFHHATLTQLTEFYGVAHTLAVLQASQTLQDCIPKPQEHEWCIGHFAVSAAFQKIGVGTALLNFMNEKALNFGKSHLCLDVESINTQAVKFYLGHGFQKNAESGVSLRMKTLGLGAYFHLSKQLI
ncbi:MAG: GNAT family N-acetyltransferase [Paraglaciecola sp.]|uniref:GNAT family N-acetyltransferase n=1 Tax=Paraglaciecola sp. TaxID=1920173 RepID=UPI0032995ABD